VYVFLFGGNAFGFPKARVCVYIYICVCVPSKQKVEKGQTGGEERESGQGQVPRPGLRPQLGLPLVMALCVCV